MTSSEASCDALYFQAKDLYISIVDNDNFVQGIQEQSKSRPDHRYTMRSATEVKSAEAAIRRDYQFLGKIKKEMSSHRCAMSDVVLDWYNDASEIVQGLMR